jgi:hypothetical protein
LNRGGKHGGRTCIEEVRNLLEKADYASRKKQMYFMLGMVKESTQNAPGRFFPKIGLPPI